MADSFNDGTSRIAVLEHRADKQDKAVEKIENWMDQLTKSQVELVRLQTDRANDSKRIEHLEARIEQIDRQRIAQHQETRQLAADDRLAYTENSFWIELGKQGALIFIGAAITIASGLVVYNMTSGG